MAEVISFVPVEEASVPEVVTEVVTADVSEDGSEDEVVGVQGQCAV